MFNKINETKILGIMILSDETLTNQNNNGTGKYRVHAKYYILTGQFHMHESVQ